MEAAARKPVEYTFPEEYHGHAKYREAPFHLRQPFIEHVKQTYEPETFPGLYWGRLNKNEPFEVIETFAVDRKKRPEGDYIPCPMCQRREKFLEGAFVFIFARQCIAIIGHDCATAEIRHAAFSKKKQDDLRRQQEDFLLAKLVHVPRTLGEIRTLMDVAKQVEGIYHDFSRGAPTVQKALRQVRKAGGEYLLHEVRDNPAALYNERASKKITTDYHFGPLAGEALVRSSYKPLSDLRRYEQWLLSFDGCDDEEKAMDMTIGLLQRGEATKAVHYIGEARRKLQRLRWEMSTTTQFFGEYHVDNLRQWATHPLHPMPFSVERQVRHDGILLVIARNTGKDQEREYARLFLPNSLAEWADANRERPAFENL
jgi:hypothetical protein